MRRRGRNRLRADVTVDVTDDEVIDLREPPPGTPRACPACGAPGHLDRIDPARRVQISHCLKCECRWRRSLDDPHADVDLLYLPPR